VLIAGLDRSFIFSLSDLSWRKGEKLPQDIDETISVQLDDGFLAVGGKVKANDDPADYTFLSQDTLYKFGQETYEWSLQAECLNVARHLSAAVAVPEDFFAC